MIDKSERTATMRTGEEVDAFAKRAPHAPTPIGVFHALLAVLKDAFAAERTKREIHESRITVLETANSALAARVTGLESHVKTAPGGAKWGGEFERGKSYAAGEFVGRKGAVWVCLRDSSSEPGASLGDWDCVIPGRAQP
jgi:hypothetical protein